MRFARGGKVVAKLVEDVKGSTIAEFIKQFVKTEAAELYTDQYKGYNEIGKEMKHETMNRREQWEPDGIHTNTMGRFLVLGEACVVWLTSPLFNGIHPAIPRRNLL